jgi:hypothetical protein
MLPQFWCWGFQSSGMLCCVVSLRDLGFINPWIRRRCARFKHRDVKLSATRCNFQENQNYHRNAFSNASFPYPPLSISLDAPSYSKWIIQDVLEVSVQLLLPRQSRGHVRPNVTVQPPSCQCSQRAYCKQNTTPIFCAVVISSVQMSTQNFFFWGGGGCWF